MRREEKKLKRRETVEEALTLNLSFYSAVVFILLLFSKKNYVKIPLT